MHVIARHVQITSVGAVGLYDGAAMIMVGQHGLREQLARALEHADADDDSLIAALLSQCLALMDERRAAAH